MADFQVLQFDVIGKFAHFRKYYSTNTALSFSLPPRTVIIGMLAAILGKEKDSYYQDFTSEHIKIGVFSASPIKKVFHRINLLMVKGVNDLTGRKGHIQTPFEIIIPYDIREDFVRYRIYLLSVSDKGEEIIKQLVNKFTNKNNTYLLSLGLANFSAFVDGFQLIDAQLKQALEQEIPFHSAVDSTKVKKLIFRQEDDFDFVEEDMLPAEFYPDRRVKRFDKLLFTLGGKPIKVIFSGEYFTLDDKINIEVF